MTFAASATLIDGARCVPATTMRRYSPSTKSAVSGVDPEVTFTIRESLPEETLAFGEDERYGLGALLAKYTGFTDWRAEDIHNAVYQVAEETNVSSKVIFTAVYIAILGQKRGPRLGWFLEALGSEFVTGRIAEAVNAGAE